MVQEEPLIVNVPRATLPQALAAPVEQEVPVAPETTPPPAAPSQVAKDISAIEARILSEVAPVVAEPEKMESREVEREDVDVVMIDTAMGGMEEEKVQEGGQHEGGAGIRG